jgi:integral membrane protein
VGYEISHRGRAYLGWLVRDDRGVNPRTAATVFRIVAVAEALSWLGLLAGMYVKYVPQTSEVGVQVFGPIHGAIFVAYVVVALVASRVLRWDVPTTLLALVASVPPLATVVFERWVSRTRRLPSPETAAA